MSPKTAAKKPAPVKSAPAKAAKKSAKSAKDLDEAVILAAAPESAEDEVDEDEAAPSASGGGGNAAALAAATSTSESASFKNFRHHPDMENFYRFIYENDLRLEALAIIDEMMVQKQTKKLVKNAKLNAH